jgi:hypothetical protein
MLKHHEEAMIAAVRRIRSENEVIAILLGGSIARGVERPESDVDLIVIVSDAEWERRYNQSALTFLWHDVASYEGGYVEGRYISESFLREAAERGSEPTRHSFTSVYPVFTTDDGITQKIKNIPVYPEHEQQYRIDAFMAQMYINRIYFWPEGVRRQDPYLRCKASSEIVLFGGRLILAHNRILFPCQRRLMEYVIAAPEKPEGFVELASSFLSAQTHESMDAFCKAVESFRDWNLQSDLESNFERDMEMSWFTRTFSVAEW